MYDALVLRIRFLRGWITQLVLKRALPACRKVAEPERIAQEALPVALIGTGTRLASVCEK